MDPPLIQGNPIARSVSRFLLMADWDNYKLCPNCQSCSTDNHCQSLPKLVGQVGMVATIYGSKGHGKDKFSPGLWWEVMWWCQVTTHKSANKMAKKMMVSSRKKPAPNMGRDLPPEGDAVLLVSHNKDQTTTAETCVPMPLP